MLDLFTPSVGARRPNGLLDRVATAWLRRRAAGAASPRDAATDAARDAARNTAKDAAAVPPSSAAAPAIWSERADEIPTPEVPGLLAQAEAVLAARQAAPVDHALRVIAAGPDAPIVHWALNAAARLSGSGVRLALLLRETPADHSLFGRLALLREALGDPAAERLIRCAVFPGAASFVEQAMVGDRAHWAGAPLGDGASLALAAGRVTDLDTVADGPDAARLAFSAAWRLSRAPSVAVVQALRRPSETSPLRP